MAKIVHVKHDRFQKARGGHSRFLEVACASCAALVAIYQKDGPGPLKRMYFDRIHAPAALAMFQYRKTVNGVPNLKCPNCRMVLGVPYVYPKERRLAFRLFQGAVTKRVTSANSLRPS